MLKKLIVALADLGKGLTKNAVTSLVDVQLSDQPNALTFGPDNGLLLDPSLFWKWIDYVAHWDVTPVKVGTCTAPVAGDVYSYALDGVTRYRVVPTVYNAEQDAFYTGFSSGVCTGLIVTRG